MFAGCAELFTGIIEEKGILRQVKYEGPSARLVLDAELVLEDVHIGDSIAVNGVCLTVVVFNRRQFEADIMPETLRKTNLGMLKAGDEVNLERALKAGSRLGGHIVSGHIDGVGTVKSLKKEGIATLFEVQAPEQVMKYVIPKGSIAIDGTSLTVVDCTRESFRVSLIPHTSILTVVGRKKAGDPVNLEADMMGKYVERILSFTKDRDEKESGLTMEFLAEKGFI